MKSDIDYTNLVMIFGVKKTDLNEVFELFKNFQKDYDYDIKLFEAGDNIHQFTAFKNKFLVIYGEDENEFRIIKDEFDRKHMKNVADKIILCSKIDIVRFVPWFSSHCYIEMSSKDNAFVEVRKILDSYLPKQNMPIGDSKESVTQTS